MVTLCCETCAHWTPADRTSAYAAPCALLCYPGRVAFDQGCDKHSSKPQPAPTPDMQSQARGLPPIVSMFGPIGGKP